MMAETRAPRSQVSIRDARERDTVKIALPILIVLIMLIYMVARAIGRVWVQHRAKLMLLKKIERKPELLRSFDELEELLEGNTSDPEAVQLFDFTITGVILAIIGIAFVVGYATIGSGRWAVGAYWGGVVCVALGLILALVGIFIRFLNKAPREKQFHGQTANHRWIDK
jgi:hypothetical protein